MKQVKDKFCIVILGNSIDDVTSFGPFKTKELAEEFGKEKLEGTTWTTAPFVNPENLKPECKPDLKLVN